MTFAEYIDTTGVTFLTSSSVITAFQAAVINGAFLTFSVFLEEACVTAQATLSVEFASVAVREILLAARATGW